MFDVAISQLTTIRWNLEQELAHVTEHGFTTLSLWRPKVSDAGISGTAAALARSGIRVSSLQWAGGFTGSDGRSFRESVADAADAIATAAALAAASRPDGRSTAQPPAVVVHSGCRGGHTRSHAARLLGDAIAVMIPRAEREGVRVALKPVHPRAAGGCSFLTDLEAAIGLVESFGSSHVGLALDLWQFADSAAFDRLLPRLAKIAAIVQVADRWGPPAADADRLPAGAGCLRLERVIGELWAAGYRGWYEFDPVGESVEMLGYAGTLHEIRQVADAWSGRLAACRPSVRGAAMAGGSPAMPSRAMEARPMEARATDMQPFAQESFAQDAVGESVDGDGGRVGYRAPAGAGVRRSQASSHTVSRG